jgi:hypothetical protein
MLDSIKGSASFSVSRERKEKSDREENRNIGSAER